VVAPAGD